MLHNKACYYEFDGWLYNVALLYAPQAHSANLINICGDISNYTVSPCPSHIVQGYLFFNHYFMQSWNHQS